MKKNIEINKDNNTVTIEVSVSKRNYVKEPIISFRTKDIALLLEKEGLKVDTCIENDSIHNDGRNPKTQGRWVFKLKEETRKTPSKPVVEQKQEEKPLTIAAQPAKLNKKTKKRK